MLKQVHEGMCFTKNKEPGREASERRTALSRDGFMVLD